jgi:hypothetical protein
VGGAEIPVAAMLRLGAMCLFAFLNPVSAFCLAAVHVSKAITQSTQAAADGALMMIAVAIVAAAGQTEREDEDHALEGPVLD